MKRQWMVAAAIVLAAALVQIPLVLNADLACLLTLDEKILDGRKLGIDLFELNPPLSVYMYMPAAWLARSIGVAPELVVIILVVIEIVVALIVVDRANVAAKLGMEERTLFLWSFAFLLALLPGAVFGQREHIAVVALTPFVAVTALRRRGLGPGRTAVVAGLGAGLAMSIKPFFALVVGLPIIASVVRQRSLRPLLTPEACSAAIVVIGYGAIVATVFADYLSLYAPMVAEAYLPIRKGLGGLLPLPIVVIGASIAFLRLLAPRQFRITGDATPWLAASIGGAATLLLQGKSWPYMAFGLCTFAIAAPLLQVSTRTLRKSVAIGGAAAIVLIAAYLSSPSPGFPPLAERIQALVKHPRLLTITDHVGLSHPLVRQIGGAWVGSSCGAQLLASGAMLRESSSQLADAERARLDGIIKFERRHLLEDIRKGRPNIILVDTYLLSSFPFDWLAWANTDPELRAELSRYREAEDVGRVRILVDRSYQDQ
ncbi:hypothetical protein [Bradyrhizobium sp. CCBAU 53338]|uniref:hypothetical protein n=1 Tax=Bradyrhizobium sp. CCBAU 53338 TaxID=1325111 RepID=UPI00188D9032|nr:hypothetical protein [Bradyrhizobium sp. CCBAU 53338]QOZ54205.1 hypothetical protein XH90_24650 [Bradyrhizobium sp. CCBAU 53338]